MLTDLHPYASTRDTDLAWAKSIPSHWKIQRAKTIMYAVDIRSTTGKEELLTVSSGRGVVPRSSANVTMFQAASYVGHKLCWPDDLVINSLWAWGRGLGIAKKHGIVSTAYGVYRQRQRALEPAYLHQLVRSQPFQWELQVRSQGVWKSRLQMTDDRWLDAPLLIPPAAEQGAIIKYLAHANARINKAITAKRRLIGLLREQQRASTENLLRHASSDAPELNFGRVVRRIEQGMSPTAAEGDLDDDQWAVLSLSAVNRGAFVPSAIKPVGAEVMVPPSLELSDGDLLMTRSNTRERVGDVAIVSGVRPKTFMSDLIYRITPDERVLLSDYASLLLRGRSVRDQIESAARGSSGTMPKLAQSHIKGLRVRIPALEIQQATIEESSISSLPVITAVDQLGHEIALLQEFRTRLFADVVTGQVDVRGVAATLPDVVEVGADAADEVSPELDEELVDVVEGDDV